MIKSLVRIQVLAINTMREAIRNKLLYTLLGFSIVLIMTGVLIASLSYVEGNRIIQDVGLAAIRLFSVGIAIFVGIGLIHGEVDRRTIYTILSKPVTRAEFLLGKFAGLTLTVWMLLLTMGITFAIVSISAGALLDGGHLKAFFLIGIELMLIVALATLFSSFTTPMLSALFTLGLYILGHLSQDLQGLSQHADYAAVARVGSIIYHILPDLERFNLSVQAVHNLPIPAEQMIYATLYGCLYSAGLLFFAIMLFQRRDFK